MSSVIIWAVTRRPPTIALYQLPAPPYRRKGCGLLPKTMGRIHLHPILEGWFLIREPNFHIRRDVYFATQEEGYEAGIRAFKFLADRVVVWLTAVVEQLQTPGASVPRLRCAVYTQAIFELDLSLIHGMVQRIRYPWPDPFERSRVRCQESARRDEGGGHVPLVCPINVQGKVSSCVSISCSARILQIIIRME